MGYPIISKRKKEIVRNLEKNNIECRPIVSGSLKKQPFFRSHSLNNGNLINANIVHKYGFYLPNHFLINIREIKKMVKILES